MKWRIGLLRMTDQLAFFMSCSAWGWAWREDGWLPWLVASAFAVPLLAYSTWACEKRDALIRGGA